MFRFLNTSFSPLLFQTHQRLLLRFISTTLNADAHSLTRSYLINTCGFSPQRAASLSKHFKIESPEKSDSVVRFFTNLGFSHSQLLTVISSFPRILLSDPHKTLNPKIEFFKSKGFSNSDISNLITGYTQVLARSLEKQIIPSFDFFDNMFQSKHNFMKAVIRHSGILLDLNQVLVPNMKLLREAGVPESNVIRFIECFPRSLTVGAKRLKELMEEVKGLGFNPLRMNFVVAIHVKICLSRSTWERKEGIYKRWGWSDDDIRAAFRLYPFCMAISENKIEAIMDFAVNNLGYSSSDIVRCPVLMSMSLEKRIIPRGSVILVLRNKGLLDKDELSLNAVFLRVEKVFLDRFIYCHEKEEADELLKLYQVKLALARS